ncbi:hypothetical protein JXA80_13900, partial [bacterium]|nr:hypothetical protein [candidate division CSSED10-310 bacterium]
MNHVRSILMIGLCAGLAGGLTGLAGNAPSIEDLPVEDVPSHEWKSTDPLFPVIHAQNPDTRYTGEPYLSSADIILQWKCSEPYSGYRIELASDPSFTRLLATLTGEQSPRPIPRSVLGDGGRFYYRVQVRLAQGEWSVFSTPRWFVWDRRLSGNRVIPFGDHPYGKTEASILVKDRWGRLHMVMQHDHGDSCRRDLFWWISSDSGATWSFHDRVNRMEDSYTGPSTLAIDPSGEYMVLGYLGGDAPTCPKPVVLAVCDLTGPDICFGDYHRMDGQHGMAVRRPFLAVDADRRIHAVWDGYAEGTDPLIHSGNIESVYTRYVDDAWEPVRYLSAHQTRWFHGAATLACT